MLGLDFAGGRPCGSAIAAAGYGFVCRYLTDGGAALPSKLFTLEEYEDLKANHVAAVANFETTADRALGGFAAGVADAQRADATCRQLGIPDDRPIYMSIDFDATPAQQAEIDDYLRGCASVLGIDRVGVYGGFWVVKRCLDNHTASWAWQSAAWSGGNEDPRIHIYQRAETVIVNGVECDVNEARQPDFGQHPSGITPLSSMMEEAMISAPFSLAGTGHKIIPCPVGEADGFSGRRVVVSVSALDLHDTGFIEILCQTDTQGVEGWTWSEADLAASPDNNYPRKWRELKDGTTKLVLRWDFTNAVDASLVLETKPTR